MWNQGIVNPKNGRRSPTGHTSGTVGSRGPAHAREEPQLLGLVADREEPQGDLDRLIIRFITNTNSEIQAMKSGEVDTIYPQPQLALADLKGQPGLKIQSNAGLSSRG